MDYEINNYYEYICQLIKYKYNYGGMSESFILNFINKNNLTIRFGIDVQQVKTDLAKLTMDTVAGIPAMTIYGGQAGIVEACGANVKKRYYDLISVWAKNLDDITVKKLEGLIKSNHFESFGVTLADVVEDMRQIWNKKTKNSIFLLLDLLQTCSDGKDVLWIKTQLDSGGEQIEYNTFK